MEIHTDIHGVGAGLHDYVIASSTGSRTWQAENVGHAREQHIDAFPDETIFSIRRA